MSIHGLHHVVFHVGDLPPAESFYCELFDAEVRFREGTLGDEFGKVPDGMDWPAAVEAGVEPSMSFLGRDSFTVALVGEPADAPEGGRLDHVALAVDDDSLEAIGERARELDCDVEERGHSVFVTDRYGVEWELNPTSPPPETGLDPLDV